MARRETLHCQGARWHLRYHPEHPSWGRDSSVRWPATLEERSHRLPVLAEVAAPRAEAAERTLPED